MPSKILILCVTCPVYSIVCASILCCMDVKSRLPYMSHVTCLVFCAACPVCPISCVQCLVCYVCCEPHTLFITCLACLLYGMRQCCQATTLAKWFIQGPIKVGSNWTDRYMYAHINIIITTHQWHHVTWHTLSLWCISQPACQYLWCVCT